MRYALVAVEAQRLSFHGPPLTPAEKKHNWEYFLDQLRSLSLPDLDDARLGEGLLQLDLSAGLSTLLAVANQCEKLRLTYRVLFLKEKPEWIENKPATG